MACGVLKRIYVDTFVGGGAFDKVFAWQRAFFPHFPERLRLSSAFLTSDAYRLSDDFFRQPPIVFGAVGVGIVVEDRFSLT